MVDQLYILPILLFSVVIHEVAHGAMALKLGDPTAQMLGRLTLNPLPHIDLIGSIIVPLLSLVTTGSVFIAWAKPIPVNRENFARPRRDDVLVSLVGPGSNLALACVCCVAVIVLRVAMELLGSGIPSFAAEAFGFLVKMFYGGIVLNIVLAVFNLIPVPPLDGSHVLAAFLPSRLARGFQSIGFAGVLLLIFLMRVPLVSETFRAVITGIFAPFSRFMQLFV